MELLERILSLLNTSTASDLRSAAELLSAEQGKPENNTLLRMLFFCLSELCSVQAGVADRREEAFMSVNPEDLEELEDD